MGHVTQVLSNALDPSQKCLTALNVRVAQEGDAKRSVGIFAIICILNRSLTSWLLR